MGFLNSLISKITGGSRSSSEQEALSHSPGTTVVHNNPLYTPDEQHEFVNPLYNPAPLAVPERETPLGALQKNLEHSQKGGLRSIFSMSGAENSEGFQSLLDTLGRVNEQCKRKLSGDVGADAAKLQEFSSLYDALIAACEQYMNRRAVLTSAGRERQRIVGEVYDYAVKDREAIDRAVSDIFNIPADQRSGISFGDIIAEGRMLKFEVENINANVGGANASVVYRLSHNSKDYFFKGEENVRTYTNVSDENEYFNIAFDAEYKNIPDDPQYADLRKNLADVREGLKECRNAQVQRDAVAPLIKNAYELAAKPCPPDEQIAELAPVVYRILKATNASLTTAGVLDSIGLGRSSSSSAVPEELNVSKRNVATSRMAELLGVGHLIAHSETAEVTDRATSKSVRGNLMEKAEGVELEEAFGRLGGHTSGDISGAGAVTGGFQRATICVQMLDSICSQVDRHAKNMMYQFDANGALSGIQGIDNDLAFGQTERIDSVHQSQNARQAFSKGRTGVQMSIPYMDKAMARNIIALAQKPDTVRFVMQDVLREAEIEALITRLNKAAEALQAAMTEDESKTFANGRRFLEADEWDANRDAIHTSLMQKKDDFEQRTYYSNFMEGLDQTHAAH